METGRRWMMVVLTIAAFLALVPRARALGIRYPDHVRDAVGCNADVVTDLTGRPVAWLLEASDRELFGEIGLRVTGARASVRRGAWEAAVEAAQLSAAVGRETRIAARWVRHARASPVWSVGVGAAHEQSAVGDAAATARLTSLHVHTAVSALEHVRVRCNVDGVRVAGLANPGADIETSVTVSVRAGLAVTTALTVDRRRGAHARVSAAFCLLASCVVVAGYDDENASLSLAVAVVAEGVRAVAAASVHPVLGLSRGASLGWQR